MKKGYIMIQGSNMTRSHKGMRKGISLVEMLVAIVLFGIIGTISYTYYKNYYDTSFAAKQLRVYTIVDQAAQLSNAFDLYNTKNGTDINTSVAGTADAVALQLLVSDRILTEIPRVQPAISTDGWIFDDNISVLDKGLGGGKAFTYDINNTTLSLQDQVDYCNILNEVALSTWSLDTNNTDTVKAALAPTGIGIDDNKTWEFYAAGIANPLSEMEYFHCADNNSTTTLGSYQYVFIKRANVPENR